MIYEFLNDDGVYLLSLMSHKNRMKKLVGDAFWNDEDASLSWCFFESPCGGDGGAFFFWSHRLGDGDDYDAHGVCCGHGDHGA
eukprot:CAMPEP_0170483734 /NCGR_PEP_ID=MMETSP0208-20121228/3358_1 /TAXON_ID=197538 /ORGANISM="Strombidium inclinatum, Strain S3" /LENGTH=82 /DNA_ID=CAMNT_0010756875 /DNA_START=471 /DNA_END=719 /DNA_ORIENTATION=-